MKKFLLHFCYDGTDFHGWQNQKDEISIQFAMEKCLTKIFKVETRLTASGRTDKGVHAYNQYAHFSALTRMSPENIIKALNGLLPKSIYIKNCKVVDANFHARFSAKSRTYLYKINKSYNPFERNYTAFFPKKIIKTEKIKKASNYLIGTYDFDVFAHDTSHLSNCLCTITSAKWEENDKEFQFFITANRFLHNMVRRIVGTLLKISHYDLPDNYIQQILEKQDYSMLGDTAPPEGLYLYNINF